ncbi:unnamed protein product [Tetraodon nigroviridis]|uniref:(spotted green pufferfish) hypothetical protein n=1 Tax=Tetraodon nigroviridis TaxID=99883 RepID=Q4RTA4_TETNG|nr:unnamed protein product [Tetraodon nigroviridis]
MEQTDNPAPENNNPNGFVNRMFSVSLDVENETSSVCIQEFSLGPSEGHGGTQDGPLQTPVKDRQEVNKRPRVTGGIWKILNRKRTASELERRPHSMILPGEASVPKLSFADKVRSFKKLKSPSVFRGKTGKLSSAKLTSSLGDEDSFYRDIGTPQQPKSSVRCTPSTHHGRGRRHKDVWSYLRRISLLGKSNPVYSERSFDSELHSLDKTMDSDYGSGDIENDCQPAPPPAPPKSAETKGHFGGFFRFFNSVAETARKWRTTSHSFSPPEGDGMQLGSPRAQQHAVGNIHSVSLTVLNEQFSKPTLAPSSPLTVKSTHSSGADDEDTQVTGGQSPTVVLKAFRQCSAPQAANGLQGFSGPGDHIHTETNPTVTVENHIPLSCPSTENQDAVVQTDRLNCLREEETLKGQTGNEQDSKDARPDSQQTRDENIQSRLGDEASTTNSVPVSDSTEEIFKRRKPLNESTRHSKMSVVLSWSHRFHHHVCAESALEIIYGFKNTAIERSFGVTLLHFFPDLFIPELLADCEDTAEDREALCPSDLLPANRMD